MLVRILARRALRICWPLRAVVGGVETSTTAVTSAGLMRVTAGPVVPDVERVETFGGCS